MNWTELNWKWFILSSNLTANLKKDLVEWEAMLHLYATEVIEMDPTASQVLEVLAETESIGKKINEKYI